MDNNQFTQRPVDEQPVVVNSNKFTKRTFSTGQSSLLMKSMLIAGAFFILIGIGSLGFTYMFLNVKVPWNMGFIIFMCTLLGGMISSMLWTVNMFKNGSIGLTILCYLVYVATMSVAFGWLFTLVTAWCGATWCAIAFAIVGGVFLISALMSKLMGLRSALTMGKMIAGISIAMSIFFLAFFIAWIVFMCVPTAGSAVATDAFMWLIMAGMSIVSFLYMIIDIWSISKMSEFAGETGADYGKITPWFFGFKLLTDLINVLLVVIWFILRFARR